MSIQIKDRWTGAVLRMVEAETLSRADLSGANLSGADLSRAYLSDANLSGADLCYANLSGARLSGADLSGADLCYANLSRVDLSGANLSSANLSSANLSGAYLSGADLEGADLSRADLSGVAESLGIATDPMLPARIVDQISEHPESWNQGTWHTSCGTCHCIAGFATHLSGDLGRYLDKSLGTPTAAALLLWRPGVVLPSFEAEATEEETLGRLRAMAAAAEQSK